MAKLTPKKRTKLPAREFGLPEKARSEDAKKEPATTRCQTKATRSALSASHARI